MAGILIFSCANVVSRERGPFYVSRTLIILGLRGGVVRFFSKIPIRSTSVCVCVCTCCRLIGWLLCVKMRWPSLGGFSPAPDPTATCCCFVGGKLTNVHRRGFGQKSCARPLTFPKFSSQKGSCDVQQPKIIIHSNTRSHDCPQGGEGHFGAIFIFLFPKK